MARNHQRTNGHFLRKIKLVNSSVIWIGRKKWIQYVGHSKLSVEKKVLHSGSNPSLVSLSIFLSSCLNISSFLIFRFVVYVCVCNWESDRDGAKYIKEIPFPPFNYLLYPVFVKYLMYCIFRRQLGITVAVHVHDRTHSRKWSLKSVRSWSNHKLKSLRSSILHLLVRWCVG